MITNGLKLFVADIVDEETGVQEIWYVVGKTYDSSLKRFIKWANKMWYRYAYYFYEADNDTVENFMEYHKDENIKADIYD